MKFSATIRRSSMVLALGLTLTAASVGGASARGTSNPNQSGSTGLQGTISAPAPKSAPTISLPVNGRDFTSTPITVSGLCTSGLLVKVFSNNIFVGSVNCTNNNYSLQIDLVGGQNSLVADQYDALDQSSPDSNTVNVTFSGTQVATLGARVSLTSQYAKLGADTGTKLTWPILLSGGTGPYAISVDWGDSSASDLMSVSFPGEFNISHVYNTAGIYTVIVRATDSTGQIAFLQLVGVGNGKVTQGNVSSGGTTGSNGATGSGGGKQVVLWPVAVLLPLALSTFWLGKKYEIQALRRRIEHQQELYGQEGK